MSIQNVDEIDFDNLVMGTTSGDTNAPAREVRATPREQAPPPPPVTNAEFQIGDVVRYMYNGVPIPGVVIGVSFQFTSGGWKYEVDLVEKTEAGYARHLKPVDGMALSYPSSEERLRYATLIMASNPQCNGEEFEEIDDV